LDPSSTNEQTPHRGVSIEDASAWVLRGGLVCCIVVMLVGIIFSFVHGHASLNRMQNDGFDYRPAVIWQGICQGHGKSIIEAGIYLLLLTPIMRVAVSFVLFAVEEHDWVYAFITLIVLMLTLAGLIWFG
jgi:uncharacterized membrane protein